MDEADLLLDRPPGGWGDLVTNQTLELRFAAFEAHIEGRFAELGTRTATGFEMVDMKLEMQRHDLIAEIERGFRRQTWQLVGAMTALMAIVVAALRV